MTWAFLATCFYNLSFSPRRWAWRPWADGTLGLSFGLQTFTLIWATYQNGSLPYNNLYGSVLFLSWILSFLLVVYGLNSGEMGRFQHAKAELFSALTSRQGPTNATLRSSWMLRQGVFPVLQVWVVETKQASTPSVYRNAACLLSPLIFCLHVFCAYLPWDLKQTQALIPALQSHWLEMHVASMLTSYGLLFCGGLFAAGFLSLDKTGLKSKMGRGLSVWLDTASYRTIGGGFSFLTLGLLSGAVWANETWSAYFSFDVKETWALITWLIFAMYLHTRLFKGWRGRASAWFALLGLVSVWITYLGVNLLGLGLHTYGFMR